MDSHRLLTIVLVAALVVVMIIGLVDIDLLVSLMARVIVGILIVGTVVVLVRSLFPGK
jgi:hypothetical protein